MHIANLLHELHGGPTEGVDRPLHLRQAKARMFRRKPDVGRQQELDATPGAVAVDGCDDGLRIRFRLQKSAVDHPGCLLGCGKVVADICASTERPITRSGDNYAAALKSPAWLHARPSLSRLDVSPFRFYRLHGSRPSGGRSDDSP